MMEKKYYYHFLKEAGGPGSGVQEENTKEIDFLETSPLISIGHRTRFLNERSPVETTTIDVSKIKYKGQENFVPKKLKKFIDAASKGETWMWEKPVDVLRDDEGDYHIIDGHHRGLAAILLKKKKLKVNVYTMNNVIKKATIADDFKDSFLSKATSDEDKKRLSLVWGLQEPSKEESKRLDLVDENKENRPEAFN